MSHGSVCLLLVGLFLISFDIARGALCPFKTTSPVSNCTVAPFPLSACGQDEEFVPTLRTGICRPCKVVVSESMPGYLCEGGRVRLCPAGHVCPYNNTAKTYNYAKVCEEGTLCMAGFTEPIQCSSFALCPAGSTTRGIIRGSIVLSLIILFIGLILGFVLQRRQNQQLEASAKLRSDFKATKGEQLGSGLPISNSSVRLRFKNVGMKLKSNGATIVDGVSGYFPAGSLVALMGPSGAGKTSFMNALLSRAPYADITGAISVNGINDGIRKAPNVVGFVPQDDICHADLTVFQNLYYNALLRLPRKLSEVQKRRHVQSVINALGLSHIQNHLVGSPSRRGISGGQKKRVNIGMELVAMPSIIFMDEPTSGLDGTATLELAQCLIKLRETGLTIICVIHQPRYAVFKSFSHVLLLGAGGQQIYGGRREYIMKYFLEQGFRLPENENPADWIIDIVSGFSPKYKSNEEKDEEIEEEFQAPSDLFDLWKSLHSKSCDEPQGRWNAVLSDVENDNDLKPLQNRETPNTCVQSRVFFQRVLDQHNNRSLLIMCLMLWIAAAMLSSLRSGNEYRFGKLYSVLPGSTTILAMVCSVQSHTLIYKETLQYYREFKSGISAVGYFVAKLIYDICRTFCYSAFWALACYTINPPIQGLLNPAYIWTFIAMGFYWSSFGSLMAVIFPTSYTTGLLIQVFLPAMERLYSGIEAENLGGIPIRDFVGLNRLLSVMSSGRWVTQGLYCGEIMSLPSHIRNFESVSEKLYNISVINTLADGVKDTELGACAGNAILYLFLVGTLFRLLTLSCFLLTKYSQGLSRRSQMYYIMKMYLDLYCFDENLCTCCLKGYKREEERSPFDHTNLNAVLKPDNVDKARQDQSVKTEDHPMAHLETDIAISINTKKRHVHPTDE